MEVADESIAIEEGDMCGGDRLAFPQKIFARKEACHDIDHSKEIVERSILHSGDSNYDDDNVLCSTIIITGRQLSFECCRLSICASEGGLCEEAPTESAHSIYLYECLRKGLRNMARVQRRAN